MTSSERLTGKPMNSIHPWWWLTIAIVAELIGTSCLKLANGWQRPWAWSGVIAGYGVALWLVSYLVQKMEISVVYSIWSGVGIALLAVIGVLAFHESVSWTKAAGLFAIILGIVLLRQQTAA